MTHHEKLALFGEICQMHSAQFSRLPLAEIAASARGPYWLCFTTRNLLIQNDAPRKIGFVSSIKRSAAPRLAKPLKSVEFCRLFQKGRSPEQRPKEETVRLSCDEVKSAV
jgi:hypothetical protein